MIRIHIGISKGGFFMQKKTVRVVTNQPGVYKNQKTGKYDVKHNYTSQNPQTGGKSYEQEWTYGINSYTEAVKLLSRKKARQGYDYRNRVYFEGGF